MTTSAPGHGVSPEGGPASFHAPPPERPSSAGVSLATRVARSAALAAAVSALIAAVATSALAGFFLQQEEDRRLNEAALDLVFLLGNQPLEPSQIAAVVRHEHEETEHAGTRFRVSDARGEFVAGELPGELVLPGQCSTREFDQIRLCSVSAPSGVIVTAASAHAPRELLFVLAALVAATFAGLVTWLWILPMARSAVAPLSRLRSHVAAVDIERGGSVELGEPERVIEVDELRTTLRQLLQRLGAALAQAQRFAANAAHELRTPLTALRAELELFGEHPAIPIEIGSNVVTAQLKLVELITLVEKLLILAAPRRHPNEVAEVVSLRDLMEDVLQHLGPASAARVQLGQDDALVRGDSVLLSTLFANAFTNALRFGTTIQVGLERRDGIATVRIDDDGPGIDPPELERVFEPFYRGQRALRERQPGHGLGLALVRHIAETHGGSASFDAQRSAGARLRIVLPELAQEAEARG